MADEPAIIGDHLRIARCPWCGVAGPACKRLAALNVECADGTYGAQFFACGVCGGPMATQHRVNHNGPIFRITPLPEALAPGLPPKVEHFLRNARETFHAASASIMVSASAVDAMLKERGYTQGKLYPRIEKAAKDGVLTEDMKLWAHEVRLDSNDERHADEDAALPTPEDARRVFEFAETLAELLFILPARVRRGLEAVAGEGAKET